VLPAATPAGGTRALGATPAPLFVTPAGGIAAPPLPATVTVGPPQMTPPPASVPVEAAGPIKNASDSFLGGEANRSGLLVVLDDDQDIPPLASERIAKGQTGSGSGTGRVALKIDSFTEDEGGLELPEPKQAEPGTGSQAKLPDLPPLPKP
jgi:hypothetical protein